MSMQGVSKIGLALVIGMLIALPAYSQTFILQPATTQNSDGDFQTKLLMKKNSAVRVAWTQADGSALNLSGTNSKLIIGRASNTYTALELTVSGQRSDFVPDDIGLSPGRYYARVTNSAKRTASEIQGDREANSAIIYSNEILLIIEAEEAPAITAPRGTITNPTPVFQWTAISGVPSYWLIVSSTPFDIVEDESGNISIEGATIVWQYITEQTTAEYGAINYDSPFTDDAPPLNAGSEYSYTVLNVYEENNPGFTSPVFGGIVPFTYSDPNAVPATSLISPASNQEFFSEPTITFSWTDVPEATNFTINLLQIVKQQGIDVTIPIWTSTTTNTLIEYPAIENLKNGTYQWNVISNNSSGGGTTSSSRFFNYRVETGEFGARIRSSVDGSIIQGVELSARAISGGVNPAIPFFVQNATHYDSLVAGTYQFSAEKEGYENGIKEATIEDGESTIFTIQMIPLPSSLQGEVIDENGNLVDNADIRLTKLADDVEKTSTTDINGEFTISAEEGSYTLSVMKTGYISAEDQTITLNLNEQKTLSEAIEIRNDQATISGVVYNEEGNPIQRAKVTISNAESSVEANTNGSGVYQFTVGSGDWILSVEKIGFVKPRDQTISLSTGDILQNQNFTLTGNANQITGFVRERISNDDGSTGSAAFENILVSAIPDVGEAITARSGRNGQYTLSLKSGSYTIQAYKANYTSNLERELVIGIAVGETISGMDFEMIPNPSSISGTVLLPNGNGVDGANVTVAGVGTVSTSSSGFYEISVPQGTHQVSVAKTSLVSPSPKSVSVTAGQALTGVDFEMTPNAGSVSGRITSGGEPLSNTVLTAVNTANGNEAALTNNLNGTYTFNLSSGNWYIKAEKSGFLPDSTELLSVGPGQQVVNQNLALTRNQTTVRGTITDGTNAIRNAIITVTKPGNPSFSQSTVSQISGAFAFTLPAGSVYTLTVTKTGYRTSVKTTSMLVAGETVIHDFSLAANPSSVSGLVTVNGGGVLGSAKIVAINESGIRVDSINTATSGAYTLGLDPGNYSLTVQKTGYTQEQSSTSLTIGQNLTGINFSVNENFAVFSGTITDSDANALDQVFINLTKQSGGGASATTNQEGTFSVPDQIGGNYTITLSKSGFVTKTITSVVNDGDFISINESLTPKNGSISGIISDENGAIVGDATVTATAEDGSEYTAISNSTGAYTLAALQIGNYTLNASKTGYTTNLPVSSSLTAENLNRTGVNIANLTPNNGEISGKITNSATNAALKNVQVSASGSRGSGLAVTASNGSFQISNLIPDTYRIISIKEGYKPDTVLVTIDPSNPTSVSNQTLIQNNGSIVGTVTDPDGTALPFRVSVEAAGGNVTATTLTNSAGDFTFEGMETGVSYTITTDIYKEGYDNVETTVQVPLGANQTSIPENLEVEVAKGIISGTVGESGVSVALLNASTREIVKILSSTETGSFNFDFLEAGRYKLTAKKLGYTFSPDTSAIIDLDFDESATQNFTAQANIGHIAVVVKTGGNAVSNVNVSVVSEDASIVLTKKTNALGRAIFSDLQATTTYLIRPTKEGFSTDPENSQLNLASGDSTTVNFELSANASSLAGAVKFLNNGTPSNLQEARVTAVLLATGQSFVKQTNKNGAYSFSEIGAGNYRVIASKEGFTPDTILISLNAGETTSADDIILKRASVDLRGKVLFKGEGVQGVKVQTLATSSSQTETNANGNFRFASLPVKTGATDTTVYQINISNGVFSKSYLVELTADDIGTRVNVPETNLPSGQISLTVTDGVDPLDGATLQFGIAGGESKSVVTGSSGSFTSSETLRKATYVVSVAKTGLLVPQNTIRIELPTDTTLLEREVILPYRQINVPNILADANTNIFVVNRSGYNNSRTTGALFYKTASQTQFTQVAMIAVGDTIRATIPAQFSTEEITFYTSITDSSRNNTYLSRQRSIVPLASGILTNIRVTPAISGQTLRVGEIYKLELFVRDGINKSLGDRFEGEEATGSVNWTNLTDTTGLALLAQEGTTVTLVAQKTGTYSIQVSADLDGSQLNQKINLQVTNIPLKNITVSSPAKQVANSNAHLFAYSAVDTSGNSVLLGSSLKWQVEPQISGSIDNRGLFSPSGSSILGTFVVSARDSVSELIGYSDAVELIARIEPDEEYLLMNGDGLELQLQQGSVDIPSQVSLAETKPADTKKFVFAQGTENSYTVGDRVYVLSFSGSELKKPAQLTLPEDTTISELNTGERQIARFNFVTLQWELLSNTLGKSFGNAHSGTVTTAQLGQFAVLAANEPLGIRYAAILPSPFSPDIAPVKIGYWLDTAFPPARVTIKIYNIRGELVRTLMEDKLQQPGRYGSSSSDLEITWNGLTDAGNMARNGRYLVQIVAKDQQTEVVELLQVVLIK